jgi:hypothetical protein
MKIGPRTLGSSVLTAALALGTSLPAFAQANPPATTPGPGTPSSAQPTEQVSQWTATAMASVLTGADLDGASGGGAVLTYLDRGWLGGEAAINFAPNVDLHPPQTAMRQLEPTS